MAKSRSEVYKSFIIEGTPGGEYFVYDVEGQTFGPFKERHFAKRAIDAFVAKMTGGPRINVNPKSYPEFSVERSGKTFNLYKKVRTAGGGIVKRLLIAGIGSPEDAEEWIRLQLGVYGPSEMQSNPPVPHIVGKIYERCLEIRASKAGMDHQCDAKCRAAGHRFKHPYKQKACIYALSDGSILIK